MLTFTATLTVKAGHEEEFERTMRAAVPKVREEPGNHAYVFHRAKDDPRIFMRALKRLRQRTQVYADA